MSTQGKGYWLKSGAYTIMQRSSMLLFGVGSFMILTRMLPKDEFGTWSLFLSITTLFEVARNGLIQNALIKYIASHDRTDHPSITAASVYLNIIITLLSLIVVYFLADLSAMMFKTDKIIPLFYGYMVISVLLAPYSQFEFLQQANFRFQGIFVSTFIRQGLFFVGVAVAWLAGWEITLAYLIAGQIVSLAVATFASYFFTRNYLTLDYRYRSEWIWKLFHFGKYVFGTNISGKIFSSVDQILLGGIISTSAVADYNPAVRITMLVDVPTTSAAQVVFPQSARIASQNDRNGLRLLYEKSVAVILLFLIPFVIGIFLFPKLIVLFIAGEGYYNSIEILQVTILYSVLVPFTRQSGTIWDSMGMPRFSFLFTLAIAIVNIGLNYWCILQFGVIGAAYGTFASYFIGFVATLVIMRRMLGVQLSEILRYVGYYFRYSITLVSERINSKRISKTL
ncbi:flippase [Dawidia soli]|uniref:Flippase n=1 Tax=Dawidia soli TaxID=2782352 RepID=A0AAP2D789_9BACT|nr:flippase [Dawidia soli]MBT1686399.1 flippase [Dawidia soli]